MTSIADLHLTLQELLTTTANELARKTSFIRRERQVTGASFAQALVLGGLAQPNATRKQLHHQVIQTGVTITLQGFDQRFTETSVVFMRQLLENTLTRVVCSETQPVLLPHFNGVYVTDCTRLVWDPVGLKLAVRWELQHGQLQAGLTPLKQHDQKAEIVERPLPPGSLHLGDLGFFKLKRFRQWSADGVFWLTRYKVGIRLTTPDGQPIDLTTGLLGDDPITFPVIMGCGRHAVTATLIAAPLPPAALDKRRARLQEEARLDQRPLSQRRAELAGWTIYLTNIPDLTFDQAHILARTRWQIELLFKLWKSHGQVLRSRSADPLRRQCEGYAKLIGVLIAHWTLLVAGWQPHQVSAVDAFRILRTYISWLQNALRYPQHFADFVYQIQHDLRLSPPWGKRRKTQLAFQLWADFSASYP